MRKLFRLGIFNQLGIPLLLLILTVIILTSIKPKFFLIGWDNFSTSLNPFTNLERTLTATWRAYRGFGVASDSEVTDIFRQIFFALNSLIFPKQLLEQLYLLGSLAIGVISVYFLTKLIFQKVKIANKKLLIEISSTTAALFYLFNLYTLGTFYLPITIYVTRYAFIPAFLFLYLKLLYQKQINKKAVLKFILVALLGVASFLTATVLITLLLILILILFSHKKQLKKGFFLLLLFLGLNAFWLLPFSNYIKEKSTIIPLASTFIGVNEIQLNEAPVHFSWDRLITLVPEFFYTSFTPINSGQEFPLHPLVDNYLNFSFEKIILLIMPLLALFGGLVVIIRRKSSSLLWLPLLFFVSLFLLRKEYPPLGFIYAWLGNNLPFFKIIFRFGGAKFYPLLALSSSLLATLFLLEVFSWSSKKLSKPSASKLFLIIVSILFLFHIFTFRAFFTGKFISPQMYTNIPQAYFTLAETINLEKESTRVLHLPLEKTSYWKSYSWGYVGSTFLTFMLNKPLIDRTFEPASLENDQFHQALLNLTQNSQTLTLPYLHQRAFAFLRLFQRGNVRYIIFDKTVGKAVISRGVTYWGEYPTHDTEALLDYLEKIGQIKRIQTHRVNIFDYYSKHPSKVALPKELFKQLEKDPYQEIILYSLLDTKPMASSDNKATLIDDKQTILLSSALFSQDQTLVQDQNLSGIIYPLATPQIPLEKKDKNFTFSLGELDSGPYQISYQNSSDKTQYLVDIYGNISDCSLSLDYYARLLPQIGDWQPRLVFLGRLEIPRESINQYLNGQQATDDFLSDWHVLPKRETSQLRLAIDKTILPIATNLSEKPEYLGTVLIENEEFTTHLLVPDSSIPVSLEKFNYTDDPNCIQDKEGGYQQSLEKDSQKLRLTTAGGTSCIIQPLREMLEAQSSHAEIAISFSGETKLINELPSSQILKSSYQKKVRQVIDSLPLANSSHLCLIDSAGRCLNNHQSSRLTQEENTIIVPSQEPLLNQDIQLLLRLPFQGNYQSSLSISKIEIQGFSTIADKTFVLTPKSYSEEITFDANSGRLSFSPVLSPFSYFHNPQLDSLPFYNQSCLNQDQYRVTKQLGDQMLLYQENCYHGVYLPLPFQSDNFLLWSLDYNLLSGKFPKYKLADDFNSYLDEYLSLYQGYPSIPGFKNLQKTGLLPFVKPEKEINQQLSSLKLVTASTALFPQPGVNDAKEKLFTVEQSSENQGITAIGDFNIITLPNSWANLALKPLPSKKIYFPLEMVETKPILPSLWKITAKSPRSSNTTDQEVLLVFRQGFDRQWQLYQGSIWQTLLGIKPVKANHLKVDGLFNGWEIENSQLDSQDKLTFYAFYTPERLALIGWSTTIFIIIFILIFFKKKRQN